MTPPAASGAAPRDRAAPVIELRDVGKRFGDFVAVSGLTLDLRRGEFFSLLGPSGCGKTTALRMIAGLQEPTSGRIAIGGRDMAGTPANRRPTNMVFQSYAIFPHLNVGDNVGYGLRGRGLARGEVGARVAEALEMVELGGLQARGAGELSGGQRQRVALARALVMRPEVLLLDEPLSALDKKLREQMQVELRAMQRTLGITFVMVTHDQYEAMTMSDRIGVMFGGRLVQVDTPQRLYARPRNRAVADFIGGMNVLPGRVTGRAGAMLAVEVPGFGALRVEPNPEAGAGTGGRLVGIRPERLRIAGGAAEEEEDGTAMADGEIVHVAFYGETVQYHVRVAGLDAPLVVSMPNDSRADLHEMGDKVRLGVQYRAAIDLGEEEPPGPTTRT